MTLAVLYFWLGLSITFSSLKGIHKEWKPMLLVVILQLLVVPGIGIILSHELAEGNNRNIIIMLALAPGGVTSAIAAKAMKLNLAVNVAFSSLTALLYLFITQPFLVPLLIKDTRYSTESLFSFAFSILALGIGIYINQIFPMLAKWMDKLLAASILIFVSYHIYNDFNLGGGLNGSLVWLLIKFHILVLLVSAVLASIFFGINRAPLIVLESGFQNVSLIAAMGIPLGWSAMMPMTYGVLMFFSAAVMGVNIYLIRRCKPTLIITAGPNHAKRAIVLPPFGIWVVRERTQETITLGLAYWRQFKKWGLLGFYLRYFIPMLLSYYKQKKG